MDPKYILGIDELDSQHDGIESAFVALQEAIDDKNRWQQLFETLCEKLRFHFYAEESIMQIFAYPEFYEHRRSHLGILKSLESYKDKNLTKADSEKLNCQPMQLFLEQILTQDMRFATFIKRNKERLGIQ